MKVLLSLVLLISIFIIYPINEASAQSRAKIAAQVRTTAQLNSSVTIIEPSDIHQSSELAIDSAEAANKSLRASIRVILSGPSPRPGGMETLQQASQGKLKLTLTPKNPACQNRAYLEYSYSQRTGLSDDRNYVAFSKGVIPGSLSHSGKLEKDKKYLFEIIADAWGTSGGNVDHSIGQQTSTHELSTFNTNINISRVVQPSESGWILGNFRQGDDPNNLWRVFSVSINEMD